jgi:flagellar protein FlgJ
MRIETASQDTTPKIALEQRLRRACQDFEAVFLRHLMEKMRESLPQGGLLGNSRGEKMFRSMLDAALADEMAQSGDFGLGRVLYAQLSEVVLKEPDPSQGALKPETGSAEDTSENVE